MITLSTNRSLHVRPPKFKSDMELNYIPLSFEFAEIPVYFLHFDFCHLIGPPLNESAALIPPSHPATHLGRDVLSIASASYNSVAVERQRQTSMLRYPSSAAVHVVQPMHRLGQSNVDCSATVWTVHPVCISFGGTAFGNWLAAADDGYRDASPL